MFFGYRSQACIAGRHVFSGIRPGQLHALWACKHLPRNSTDCCRAGTIAKLKPKSRVRAMPCRLSFNSERLCKLPAVYSRKISGCAWPEQLSFLHGEWVHEHQGQPKLRGLSGAWFRRQQPPSLPEFLVPGWQRAICRARTDRLSALLAWHLRESRWPAQMRYALCACLLYSFVCRAVRHKHIQQCERHQVLHSM